MNSALHAIHFLHVMALLHSQGRFGHITALVVDEAHRGAGVGRPLVEAADRFFVEQGCARAEVTSRAQRLGAHRFDEARGYQPDARRFLKRLDSAPGG